MNCIKCGRDVRGEQVFCDACQEDMEFYPVKPGTPVQLPTHTPLPEGRTRTMRAKKTLNPEARLHKLRISNRLLTLALAVSLLAFLLMSCLTVYLLEQRDRQNTGGQGYSTADK